MTIIQKNWERRNLKTTQNNSTSRLIDPSRPCTRILFDLFYFGETFIHQTLTSNKKEVTLNGRHFSLKDTQTFYENLLTENKNSFLILKHEELQAVMVNQPKQDIYISSAKDSAIVIETDALITINYQGEKGHQLSIYPSKAPVYYNQQLIRKGIFPFRAGDQVVVDQQIIEMREEQLKIIGLGKQIQLNPWLLMKEPPLSEYPHGFPLFKRSPRIYLEEPKARIEIQRPLLEVIENNHTFTKMIAPLLGIFIFSSIFGSFGARNATISLGMWATSLLTFALTSMGYFWNKKEKKRKSEEQKKIIRQYMIQKTSELHLLQQKQKEALKYMNPSLNQLVLMAKKYHSRIYERRRKDKDFLTIQLGNGEIPISFQIDFSTEKADDWLNEDQITIIRSYEKLTNAPIALSLKEQTLGLTGTTRLLRIAIQSILFQLAIWHSYREVEFITLLQEKEYKSKWMEWRWLPHHMMNSQSAKLREIVYNQKSQVVVLNVFYKVLTKRKQQLRKAKGKRIDFKPNYVWTILEEKWLLGHELNEFLAEDMSQYGVIVIWGKKIVNQLPETITTLIEYCNEEAAILINQNNQFVNQKFVPDFLPVNSIEQAIRRLANLIHEEVVKNILPESISLLEQYGVQSVDELHIFKRWSNANPNQSLRSLIGWRGKTTKIYWDLHERIHGPHALVGGTTGSGKSEFLTTYLIGLAINFSPEDVGILIIDWKGGGIAYMLEQLPHFMGAVTNLDGGGSTRILTSIKAELTKRQKLFAENDVKNINDYINLYKKQKKLRTARIPQQPLPHLFLVVDEFAELKVNVPEFLDELTSVARIGRSLGIHLILATQKPTGVINDQIEANSQSKIALKMASVEDSKELLKTSDAAYVTRPGRGYLKVGESDTYEQFQSGYADVLYTPNKSFETVDEQLFIINELGQRELLYKSKEEQRKTVEHLCTQREAVVNKIKKTFETTSFMKPNRP